MDKLPNVLLEEKEREILEKVEELKQIQSNLDELKESLKIKSEFLKEIVNAYKKLQKELQINISEKDIKIGKYLEFYDYPRFVFKVDGGQDIFIKPTVAEAMGCKEEEK